MDNVESRILSIKSDINRIQSQRSVKINLVAVSKKQSIDDIAKAVSVGVDYLGESYLQEAIPKIKKFPTQNWDFIGRLQSNKIKHIVQHFDRIHSLSKLKHASLINKFSEEFNKVLPVFVQVNIANEETKDGIRTYDELKTLFSELKSMKHIKPLGLMTIPPKTVLETETKQYFLKLKTMQEQLNKDLDLSLKRLSMGMSRDYKLALASGSTDIRVGTLIFGERK